MSERKAFALRISGALYEELHKWADAEFRSVNGQIEFLLQKAVSQRQRKDLEPAEPEPGEPPPAP